MSSINTDTLVPSLYQCVETRSIDFLLTAVSATSARGRAPSTTFERHWPSCESLYATNTSHRKQEKFLISFAVSNFAHKTLNRKLLFASTLLKHGRHFDYWNQCLNMSMRVCYLDCHEAGLRCYLVIHIQNVLHQLQLFYFHLWLSYWLSLVRTETTKSLIQSSLSPCWYSNTGSLEYDVQYVS
jgi:hypothetical protein